MTEHSLAEHSHAQHRWPIDEDPSRAWSSIPMKADQFYPLDDVVAISDTRPSAERIVQALKGAGVLDDDVDLVDGAWFAQAATSLVQRRGVFKRLAHLLPTDESLLAREYVNEARQQHFIIVVHAPTRDEVERARSVLAAHGAREMHHYEKNFIRDL